MKIKRIVAMGTLVCFFVALPCASILNNAGTPVKETTVLDESHLETPIPQTTKNETILVKQQETEIIKNEIKEVDDYVYTTKRVNIRTQVGTNSNILFTAEVGTKLHRVQVDVIQGWDVVLINEQRYYVANQYLTLNEPVKPMETAKPVENTNINVNTSTDDLRYMAAIIWAEAGNQCEAGQQAVGIVVMNRVESEVYKNTIYDVIHQPNQFSPVKNGSFSKALNRYDNGEMPECIINAAKYALQGNKTVNYNGITYDLTGFLYFSRYVRDCRVKIQDHMFK